ncbi:MAG: nuclease [Chloroflexota bacterium]|nr:nuclease [Chloroflexota bacterium]
MLQAGHRLIVPEIIDFEVRRELIRLGNQRALLRLNQLPIKLGFHEVSSEVLRRAAHFWAEARRSGKPTADRHSLDIDMILAGHAATIGAQQALDQVLIATTNVQHLRHFADARDWASIT